MITLYTIPFSHYSERARWALDRASIPYRERRLLPLAHIAVVAPLTGAGRRQPDATGTRYSLPLLVLDDGSRLHDSGAIVRWAAQAGATPWPASFFPEGELAALEREIAERIGRDTRRCAYHALLPDRALTQKLMDNNLPFVQRALYRLGAPAWIATVRRGLGVHDAGAAKSRARILALWDRCDALLADGRPWLGGERFGAVDLTLAALTAIVLGVGARDGYGAWMPELDELPEAGRALACALRERPTGALVLRAYREERGARGH